MPSFNSGFPTLNLKDFIKHNTNMTEQDEEEPKTAVVLPTHLNGWVVIEMLPFEELYTTYKDHHRLQVFATHGLQCVVPGCPHVGVYLIRTQEVKANKMQKDHGYHVDIYTKDFVLMTRDHKTPKFHGGDDSLENQQPMCCKHNWNKGSKLIYT
jgi:hypothetical protein